MGGGRVNKSAVLANSFQDSSQRRINLTRNRQYENLPHLRTDERLKYKQACRSSVLWDEKALCKTTFGTSQGLGISSYLLFFFTQLLLLLLLLLLLPPPPPPPPLPPPPPSSSSVDFYAI